MRSAFRAPGRVNLIGDHTDYNEGFALPIAIDLECVVRSTPRSDGRLRIAWLDGDHDADRYATAVAAALDRCGRSPIGIDAEVTSTIPIGSGLSSSAALEVALALALADAAGFKPTPLELARACQEAEHDATGVPCGLLDQLASIGGQANCALLIDFRTLDMRPVTLPRSVAVLVIHSGLPRTLAGSAYGERRAACEAVAKQLGLKSLRDATAAQVAHDRFARHVVSENARVLAAVNALQFGNFSALGRLLTQSHRSLRDDFQVSTPELDQLVDILVGGGALGARLTGAGFGGCVIALTHVAAVEDLAERACNEYQQSTGLDPTPHICQATHGAGPLRFPRVHNLTRAIETGGA